MFCFKVSHGYIAHESHDTHALKHFTPQCMSHERTHSTAHKCVEGTWSVSVTSQRQTFTEKFQQMSTLKWFQALSCAFHATLHNISGTQHCARIAHQIKYVVLLQEILDHPLLLHLHTSSHFDLIQLSAFTRHRLKLYTFALFPLHPASHFLRDLPHHISKCKLLKHAYRYFT